MHPSATNGTASAVPFFAIAFVFRWLCAMVGHCLRKVMQAVIVIALNRKRHATMDQSTNSGVTSEEAVATPGNADGAAVEEIKTTEAVEEVEEAASAEAAPETSAKEESAA